MNALFVLIFTCGGALAIGRGLDLALWTDWNTGLCTAGSVWLRYGSLWAALVVGIIAARKLAASPLFCAVRANRWELHRCWAACVSAWPVRCVWQWA